MSTSQSPQGVRVPAFLLTAVCYWSGVFPFVCREVRHWEQRAGAIPDPSLRTLALQTLRSERGNLEGAAAYAAFAPRLHRASVARAAMAFQAAYDYADALSEQPNSRRAANTYRLHQTLPIALEPGASHLDYYAHNDRGDDGGYLNCLVDTCQAALCLLPALSLIACAAQRAVDRIVTYQRLNHRGPEDSYDAFAQWANQATKAETDLRWWETGAAAGSSLSVFALIGAAAHISLYADHVAALEDAYFPWIGSLHTLLDSLIDQQEDATTNQHSLAGHYLSQEEAADRLRTLAAQAVLHAGGLPDGDDHMMILAAMVSFYLATPQARTPQARLAAERVLATLGDCVVPAMLVLRVRYKTNRVEQFIRTAM